MYLLKIISFCVFLILIKNSVNCDDSDETYFKNVAISWVPEDKQRFNTCWTYYLTTRNLKDIVPKEVNTWGPFSIITYQKGHKGYVLPKASITDINNLTSIDLVLSRINVVKPGALENLPQLEQLKLGYNKLTHITPGTFANLTISVLNLNGNEITVLEPGAFQLLPNLKVLLVKSNNLQTLSDGVLNEVVNLQDLQLSSNRLSKIEPKALENLNHLTNLQLNYNHLAELNCSVLNLPELNRLNLSFNSISQLDSACFKNLPQLQELDLSHNRISVIPSDVFDISTLRDLAMNDNKLTTWDSRWLRSAPKLVKMSAARNLFEEIPDEVLNYGSYIDFGDNAIKSIYPNAFRHLKVIDYLNLENNKLENWDSSLLKNITVHHVNVQNNLLPCVDGDLEKAFGRAEHVQLNGNPWRPDCQTKINEFTYKNQSVRL